MTENVIECRNLTNYYGKRLIYENLSFDVPKGRILGLLGKNGTGKTTTINIVSGYLKPHSGTCSIFGEDIAVQTPATRRRIGVLIEGHVQYDFMNVSQIERFYSRFFPGQWRRDAYYELISKLKVAPGQRISRMSCGQRSQVALGLILAQDPDLLILDDFSLGLDPGYRRLFVEYLREYAKSEQKTVLLTSHIIQDMERLIDECIILDYGGILLHKPVREITEQGLHYECEVPDGYEIRTHEGIYHPGVIRNHMEMFSFLGPDDVRTILAADGIDTSTLRYHTSNLEDAFLGLTGKY